VRSSGPGSSAVRSSGPGSSAVTSLAGALLVCTRLPGALLTCALLTCAAWLAGACGPSEPPSATREATGVAEVTHVRGTLTVDGKPAQLVRCRPGHAVHVFVEVDTTLGTLRFGDGMLSWQGSALTCQKLDRSWGGGVRRDGSAYFRGTLGFRCGTLAGDLVLDCGQITPDEAGELARNRAAAGRAPQAGAVNQ
jgi:hypothetical protein